MASVDIARLGIQVNTKEAVKSIDTLNTRLTSISTVANRALERLNRQFAAGLQTSRIETDLNRIRTLVQSISGGGTAIQINLTVSSASITSLTNLQKSLDKILSSIRRINQTPIIMDTRGISASLAAIKNAVEALRTALGSITLPADFVRFENLINRLIKALSRLTAMIKSIRNLVVRVDVRDSSAEIARLNRQIEELRRRLSELRGEARGVGSAMQGVFALWAVYQMIKGIVLATVELMNFSQQLQLIEARLQNLTQESGNFSTAMGEVVGISMANGAALGDTVKLMERLSIGTRELGYTTKENTEMLDLLQKAGVASGATSEEMRRGMLQLSQAIAGGVFRAEEFNSIMENIPKIASYAANELGMSVGQLRKLMLEGNFEASKFLDGIKAAGDQIKKDFENMPYTLERALQEMQNAFAIFFGELEKSTGWVQTFARMLSEISKDMITSAMDANPTLGSSDQIEARIKELDANIKLIEYMNSKEYGMSFKDRLVKEVMAWDTDIGKLKELKSVLESYNEELQKRNRLNDAERHKLLGDAGLFYSSKEDSYLMPNEKGTFNRKGPTIEDYDLDLTRDVEKQQKELEEQTANTKKELERQKQFRQDMMDWEREESQKLMTEIYANNRRNEKKAEEEKLASVKKLKKATQEALELEYEKSIAVGNYAREVLQTIDVYKDVASAIDGVFTDLWTGQIKSFNDFMKTIQRSMFEIFGKVFHERLTASFVEPFTKNIGDKLTANLFSGVDVPVPSATPVDVTWSEAIPAGPGFMPSVTGVGAGATGGLMSAITSAAPVLGLAIMAEATKALLDDKSSGAKKRNALGVATMGLGFMLPTSLFGDQSDRTQISGFKTTDFKMTDIDKNGSMSGNKFSQVNRDIADTSGAVVSAVAQYLEEKSGKQLTTKELKLVVGSREAVRAEIDGKIMFQSNDVKEVVNQITSKLAEEVGVSMDIYKELGLDQPGSGPETLAETLARVDSEMKLVTDNFDLLGITFGELSVDTGKYAHELITLAGGTDAFGQKMGFFIENFYTDSEKAAMRLSQASEEIAKFNEKFGTNVNSTAGLRAIIESADASAELKAAALELAPAMLTVKDIATDSQKTFEDMNRIIGDYASSFDHSGDKLTAQMNATLDQLDKLELSESDLALARERVIAITDKEREWVANQNRKQMQDILDALNLGEQEGIQGEIDKVNAEIKGLMKSWADLGGSFDQLIQIMVYGEARMQQVIKDGEKAAQDIMNPLITELARSDISAYSKGLMEINDRIVEMATAMTLAGATPEQLETLKGLGNKLVESFTDGIEKQAGDITNPLKTKAMSIGMTELESSIADVKLEGENAITALKNLLGEEGAAPYILDVTDSVNKLITDLTDKDAAEKLKEQTDFMKEFKDGVATIGMSDLERELYMLNQAFEETITKAIEMEVGEENLATIRGYYVEQTNKIIDSYNEDLQEVLGWIKELERADSPIDKLKDSYKKEEDLIESARKKAISAWEDQVKAVEEFNKTAKELLDYVTSLKTSDLAPLSGQNRAQNALIEFNRLVKLAEGGDTEAMSQVQGAAETALELNRQVYTSTDAYTKIFGSITSALTKLGQAELEAPKEPDLSAFDIRQEKLRQDMLTELRALKVELQGLRQDYKAPTKSSVPQA